MKTFSKFLLAGVLVFCPLIGQTQATTGFHRISQVLARSNQGVTAQVVPFATISVTNTQSGSAATIYSDPLLGSLITPPVLTADMSGNYSYYIPLNYCVTETITSPGQGSQVFPNICNLGGGSGSGSVGPGNTNQAAVYPTNGSAVIGGTLSIPGGGTNATTSAQAAQNIVNGNAIAPSSDTSSLRDTDLSTAKTAALATGTGGRTDECSKVQQWVVNADTSGYTNLQILSMLSTANFTVHCLTQQFFDPALNPPSGSPPYTSSGVLKLGAGTYYVINEQDIPSLWTAQGLGGGGAIAEGNSGMTLQTDTTSAVIASQSSGSGYSGVWTCSINGGTFSSQATCSATVSAGGLVFAITSSGAYSVAPTSLSFSGGTFTPGTTASAVVSMGFQPPPWGAPVWQSTVVNFGPPLQTVVNGAFSIGAQALGIHVNCSGPPNQTAFTNDFSQQGTNGRGVGSVGCTTGWDTSSISGLNGAGGSQNTWSVDDGSWALGGGPTSQGVDNLFVSAGGSYSVCPSATFSGCSTNPTAVVMCSLGGVSSLTPVSPNWQGSGCPATGVSIAFSGGVGSGAAATPFIGTTRPPVGVAVGDNGGGGGGTFRNISTTTGGTTNVPRAAMTIDSNTVLVDNAYSESVQNNAKVGSITTAVLGGISLRGVNSAAAQNPCFSEITLFNQASLQSFDASETSGNCNWYIRDDHTNIDLPHTEYQSGGEPFYATDRWFYLSASEFGTNIPHATRFYNCNTSTDSGCIAPSAYLPAQLIHGHVSSIGPSSSVNPYGISLNGRFDTNSLDSSSVGDIGAVNCLFDPSFLPTVGDGVQVSPNATFNSNTAAGCSDGGSPEPAGNVIGYVINLGANGSTTLPTVPGAFTISQNSGANTITATYTAVAATLQDKTHSATTVESTTTGPGELDGATWNQLNGLGATPSNPYWIYRTALGDTLPTLTANCCTNGQVSSLSGLPGGSGVTFAPTISFSGGGCSTEPVAVPQVSGGVVIGVYWKNHGAGCATPPSAVLVNSTQRLGYIGFANGSTFKDQGMPAANDPSGMSVPPAAGQVDAVVAVKPHFNPTGTTGVFGPVSSVIGDVACWNSLTGASILDCGTPLNTPAWLQYLGTGADGVESVTSGTTALNGEHYYTNFNVSAGAIVTVANYLIVHATGTCTLNGTILANGATNTLNTKGVGGGSSGGSGGGAGVGTIGNNSTLTAALNGPTSAAGGTAGTSSGGNGGVGATPTTNVQRTVVSSGLGNDGFEFSGSASVSGANSGGTAVEGGGGVVLMCASITGAGVIDVAGAPGNPPSTNSEGGSSGGGGGIVILSSQAPETYGITIYAGGGAGQFSSTGSLITPLAVPGGTSSLSSGNNCTTQPILTLAVSGGSLSTCTVQVPGAACGASPSINWTVLGGGGAGGTITPTWSGGAVASCTASGGGGYASTTLTTAGSGGQGGNGWSAEFSGW